jgi:hypothetical protein
VCLFSFFKTTRTNASATVGAPTGQNQKPDTCVCSAEPNDKNHVRLHRPVRIALTSGTYLSGIMSMYLNTRLDLSAMYYTNMWCFSQQTCMVGALCNTSPNKWWFVERGIAAPELHCSLYLNILKFVFLKFQKNVKFFPGIHIHIPNTGGKFR